MAIYIMDRLTAEKQHQVMATLHNTDLIVAAISVDNAATKRKFFSDHCGGTMTT